MAIIKDGHPTTITFSAGVSGTTMANILKEKEVTPPGIQGGGPNDTSNMRNSVWRTRQPKGLKTLSAAELVISYDPALYTEMVDMVNVNQSIVITFPGGETLTFWGWVDSFVPGPATEGGQPTATVVIEPSNQNGAGTETAPVIA
jgi:hypothetical protein